MCRHLKIGMLQILLAQKDAQWSLELWQWIISILTDLHIFINLIIEIGSKLFLKGTKLKGRLNT